jgi:hypothetical protein
MSQALWIKADGTRLEVAPKNGRDFQLDELQKMVGGSIELACTVDGRYLVANEEGLLIGLPVNALATELYEYGYHAPIVGDVVVCDKKMIN